jgi:hypothetical protein
MSHAWVGGELAVGNCGQPSLEKGADSEKGNRVLQEHLVTFTNDRQFRAGVLEPPDSNQ